MNDDFLHRLREAPPPAFAARLKARLDALPDHAVPARRAITLRGVMLGFLLGGTAFAVTAISIRSGLPSAVASWFADEPTAPSTSSSNVPTRAAPPQLFPGERVMPQEDSREVVITPAPAARAPIQRASQPLERADESLLPAPSSQSLAVNAGPDGTRRDVVKVAVAESTRQLAELIAADFAAQPGAVRVETYGNGGAFRNFCSGLDFVFPDIAITSRRMTPQELQACWRNGVRGVHEAKVGKLAVVLAQNLAGPPLKLTRREIFLALAKRTPVPEQPGRLVLNPHTMWYQLGTKQPVLPIQIFGPPPGSVTRQNLTELLVEGGCRTYAELASLQERDAGGYESVCRTLRSDASFTEEDKDPDVITQKVRGSPGAVGVLLYGQFDANREILAAIEIDGVAPTAETIASGVYPATRPLYLYVKGTNMRSVPGVMTFVGHFSAAAAPRNRFARLGVTPPPNDEDRRLRLLRGIDDLQP